MTWAEDRATVGTDPSADPGAKTEGWAASLCGGPPFLPFGIGTKAINPRGSGGLVPQIPARQSVLPYTNPTPVIPFHAEPKHLDELGYVPASKLGSELLFDVISTAYERTDP